MSELMLRFRGELMLRSDWIRCAHCPCAAEAIVPVLVGSEEIDEPVCMGHIWGPATGLWPQVQVGGITVRWGPGTFD
jgi:hypothetical protein